ncbi:MAPEG family protein [Roseomonas sp. PWR1]|uniref:MAPEG family protein n=1 Tax=Roseomonas nitratireducens TaxID=2820810 RepID=A0ABS4ARQ5_9PROT|nr:MAPEG family protein [Neoroseomonas nitratireducens]MBP0464030.1 MAPEG family protein [Neoroseomonas nitratireducens]
MWATALWAALLAPVCLWLSARVIGQRRRAQVPIGTGGDAALERAVRAQANFAEYVPFALLLMALAEAAGAPGWALHPPGALLLAGRIAHGSGLMRVPEDFRFRIFGMMATFGAIGWGALACLVAGTIGWR